MILNNNNNNNNINWDHYLTCLLPPQVKRDLACGSTRTCEDERRGLAYVGRGSLEMRSYEGGEGRKEIVPPSTTSVPVGPGRRRGEQLHSGRRSRNVYVYYPPTIVMPFHLPPLLCMPFSHTATAKTKAPLSLFLFRTHSFLRGRIASFVPPAAGGGGGGDSCRCSSSSFVFCDIAVVVLLLSSAVASPQDQFLRSEEEEGQTSGSGRERRKRRRRSESLVWQGGREGGEKKRKKRDRAGIPQSIHKSYLSLMNFF